MKSLLTCFVLCALPIWGLLQEDESDLDFIKAVSNNGYPSEIHQVETADGYILTVFRIPHGKNSNVTGQDPVLLNHGMFGSALNFISLGPKKSLGYVLADNGYDVWLMNDRGSWHSNKHRTLKPDQKEFWQFSWHEIGVYDIPAVIDYILSETNKTSLDYIGHSQGCTSVFVMGSERPEYNNKIKVMIGLGPAVFYYHLKNPMLRMAANYEKVLQDLAKSLNIYEVPPPFMPAAELKEILKLICVDSNTFQKSCSGIFLLFSESKKELYDVNSIKQILSFSVPPVSVNQLFHYSQLISSGNFQQYDWGAEKNLQKYGTKYPPLYNLNNITFPAALFVGSGDSLVDEEDVKLLATKLPNFIGLYKIPNAFTHMDLIFANNINTAVNKPILKVLRRYRDSSIKSAILI